MAGVDTSGRARRHACSEAHDRATLGVLDEGERLDLLRLLASGCGGSISGDLERSAERKARLQERRDAKRLLHVEHALVLVPRDFAGPLEPRVSVEGAEIGGLPAKRRRHSLVGAEPREEVWRALEQLRVVAALEQRAENRLRADAGDASDIRTTRSRDAEA